MNFRKNEGGGGLEKSLKRQKLAVGDWGRDLILNQHLMSSKFIVSVPYIRDAYILDAI